MKYSSFILKYNEEEILMEPTSKYGVQGFLLDFKKCLMFMLDINCNYSLNDLFELHLKLLKKIEDEKTIVGTAIPWLFYGLY